MVLIDGADVSLICWSNTSDPNGVKILTPTNKIRVSVKFWGRDILVLRFNYFQISTEKIEKCCEEHCTSSTTTVAS